MAVAYLTTAVIMNDYDATLDIKAEFFKGDFYPKCSIHRTMNLYTAQDVFEKQTQNDYEAIIDP